MAKFTINRGVSGTGFQPEIEADSFKKVDGFFYFMDDRGQVIDCVVESIVRRIHRADS